MSRLTSFRLQYASNLFVDLHKQKYDTLVKPVCSTLALLGNIGQPHDAKTYHFLNYCSRNWDKIFWVSGSHEGTKTTDLGAVKGLSNEFPNVRCLDGEEQPSLSENTIVLGLPPQKFHRSNLTHTMLRTVFWSMTNPMANIVFLTSRSTEKTLIPIRGSRLDAPAFVWCVGDSTKNGLSIDAQGRQFFATNSCFVDSRGKKLPSYSPTAFVELVDRHPEVSLPNSLRTAASEKALRIF
jgi:hypothetical protein